MYPVVGYCMGFAVFEKKYKRGEKKAPKCRGVSYSINEVSKEWPSSRIAIGVEGSLRSFFYQPSDKEKKQKRDEEAFSEGPKGLFPR